MASGRENETWAGELTAADGCVKRVHLSSGQQWSAVVSGRQFCFVWLVFFFPPLSPPSASYLIRVLFLLVVPAE